LANNHAVRKPYNTFFVADIISVGPQKHSGCHIDSDHSASPRWTDKHTIAERGRKTCKPAKSAPGLLDTTILIEFGKRLAPEPVATGGIHHIQADFAELFHKHVEFVAHWKRRTEEPGAPTSGLPPSTRLKPLSLLGSGKTPGKPTFLGREIGGENVAGKHPCIRTKRPSDPLLLHTRGRGPGTFNGKQNVAVGGKRSGCQVFVTTGNRLLPALSFNSGTEAAEPRVVIKPSWLQPGSLSCFQVDAEQPKRRSEHDRILNHERLTCREEGPLAIASRKPLPSEQTDFTWVPSERDTKTRHQQWPADVSLKRPLTRAAAALA